MKKNIIVTGGAQGIGKIIVQQLAERGFTVSVFEIDDEAIAEFQSEATDRSVAFYKVDVANENAVRNAIKKSATDFGFIYWFSFPIPFDSPFAKGDASS
uniref:SDR family NAD(P)-dependent oxidoreductase n=1 Tax=uncultured Draconibacterium sp. TaxID=1573823 RepID=UPI0032170F25